MSILASDIINRARAIWKESASGDILSDTNAKLFLSDGLLELRGIRSETQLDANGEYTEHVDVAETTSTIPIAVKFRPCLVDYVVGRGVQADANLQNHEARANQHLAAFYQRARVV